MNYTLLYKFVNRKFQIPVRSQVFCMSNLSRKRVFYNCDSHEIEIFMEIHLYDLKYKVNTAKIMRAKEIYPRMPSVILLPAVHLHILLQQLQLIAPMN